MAIRVSRPMDYANRFGLQQADQAIKRDAVRALVELITNCGNSYRRLEKSGQVADGIIVVSLSRRRVGSTISVIDMAEGMDGGKLDRALGIYAEDTSGFSEGEPVRGYFGRGIKDAILGLGHGLVVSQVQNQQHVAWLGIRNGRPHYEAQRAKLMSSRSHGTAVQVTISREGIRNPHFDNLRRQLSLYFSLRDIMGNPNRTVILRELDSKDRVRSEYQINYQFRTGKLMLNETHTVPDFNAQFSMSLYRSEEPLDTPREVGPYPQAGLLIKGENSVLDNILLEFDGNVHAQRFYGSVSCNYLDELMRQNEPILLATRDGLDRSHPFVRELFRAIESIVEPFIEEEAKRARVEKHEVQDERLRQKLTSAIERLNRIARDELMQLDPSDDGEHAPLVPDTGFGFIPEYANITLARRRILLLRALIPKVIPEGASVAITSENQSISVLTPQITIQANEEFPWLGEARISIEGNQVGAEAILTAEFEGLTANAFVRVVIREETPPGGEKRRRGLFNEIKFSDTEDPRQRVRYDRDSHDVVIAIKHPSIRPYIRDTAGTGSVTPQGQVMLAELATEAVCGAIARRGVETGRFAAPVGGEVEAIQAQQLRLQNQYSGLIHQMFVESQYSQS
jgi:hypothetical protein